MTFVLDINILWFKNGLYVGEREREGEGREMLKREHGFFQIGEIAPIYIPVLTYEIPCLKREDAGENMCSGTTYAWQKHLCLYSTCFGLFNFGGAED